MSEKYPTLPITPQLGKVCPVCNKRTYSRGGIHPQCAVLRADAPRTEKIKAKRKREAELAKSN